MKVSIPLVALGAALATATPLRNRAVVEVVTEVVTKTVTVDPPSATFAKPKNFNKAGLHKLKAKPITTTPPPPPITTTIEIPPPVVVETPAAAAAPAPAPVDVVKEEPKKEEPKQEEVKQDTATTAPSQAPAGLKDATLYHHNLHRANHSAPEVSWSDSLAASAQNLANSCVFAHDTKIGPAPAGYGQNLASMGGSDIPSSLSGADQAKAAGASITNMWYNDEFGNYRFREPTKEDEATFNGWGHFTQVLWKDTTEVGCAVAACGPSTRIGGGYNSWFFVCNYMGSGNVGGAYMKNVLKPLGKAPVRA